MNIPKRYGNREHDWLGSIFQQVEDGEYVEYADYAALAAENERLRSGSFVTAVPSKEYESLKSQYEFMRGQAEKRFAEICKQDEYIEQLRLAGNAMYDAAVQDSTGLWITDAFEKWHKMNHPRTEGGSK